ncbi:MAG: tetratricopeptide repeat protein [Lachnospiraceae bacterium]|jgi:tetratricopeptide (TPR) repeat protein|nr:tetratricopeptide repeat protein [Lachnospiraceae bacterium]
MYCYHCGCRLSEHDFCTACGADVALYKKVIYVSNMYYNEGLEKAGVRDLSGAIVSLRQSLKFNKNNIRARNLLGLVYFEMGETVSALREWVISKNMRPKKNIAGEYIDKVQSNSNRLDSLNQTIKKYNRALALCRQDSRDLAVIQLKKVLSMNPRFMRAHQLLALLYMDRQEWERAERELRKCMEIDRNNLQTTSYLKEVERMLMPEEGVKQPVRRRTEEAVRYQTENEIIIQPLNVKEPKRNGLSTLFNIGIGLVIGLAAMYFLVVREVETRVRSEEQEVITRISSESDTKTARIQELESQLAEMNENLTSLQGEIDEYVGVNGTLQVTEELTQIAALYLETKDVAAVTPQLEALSQRVNLEEMSEGFQRLYRSLIPEIAAVYFAEGTSQFNAGNYAAAAESLEKAFAYDQTNEEAIYQLAQSYRILKENEKAIAAYDKVIELFPESWRAENAQSYKDRLTGN